MSSIDGLLLDIDGVLTLSWRALPGAVETVERLRAAGVPFRLATNTTTHSRERLAATLRDAGFDVRPEEIVTAAVATANYVRNTHAGARVFLVAKGDAAREFEGIDLIRESADVVVLGGLDEQEGFTYEELNSAFRQVRDGAALIGMHRNPWWLTDHGPRLDLAAFLGGLEEAAGVEATILGKPAPGFFAEAVRLLGVAPERTAMVGDDLENDVLAAQRAGLIGVLILTGKFRPEDLDRASQKPEHVLDSVTELLELLSL